MKCWAQDAAREFSSIGFFTFFFTCSKRENAVFSAGENLFSLDCLGFALDLRLLVQHVLRLASSRRHTRHWADNSQKGNPYTADEHQQSSANCRFHSQPRGLQATSEQKLLSASAFRAEDFRTTPRPCCCSAGREAVTRGVDCGTGAAGSTCNRAAYSSCRSPSRSHASTSTALVSTVSLPVGSEIAVLLWPDTRIFQHWQLAKHEVVVAAVDT